MSTPHATRHIDQQKLEAKASGQWALRRKEEETPFVDNPPIMVTHRYFDPQYYRRQREGTA